MGLKLLLDENRASTVTSVFLPEGKADKLNEFLAKLEEKGYVVYSGKGKYVEMGMFQVANMGEIYPADCEKFLAVLKETINEL